MIILGLETSCDETAAAVVTDQKKILSNVVSSQFQEHKPFGGVVPEIAARAHLNQLDQIVDKALLDAKITLDDIDGIAVAGGPGLIGGVIVGVMMAKGIAISKNIPFLPINHLEAHALTARLTENIRFPYLLLLVSGGHCQFLIVEDVGKYTYLGGTLDDAAGECIDKTARLLDLPYPGGPFIENKARNGNPGRFQLPQPLTNQPNCSFSFSGLKTAARKVILENDSKDSQFQSDFCASFQKTIGDILVNRCEHAISNALEQSPTIQSLVLAGGVAANLYFRQRLSQCMQEKGLTLMTPPVNLCTDNGAMIAWAGVEYLRKGINGSLSFEPRPRWPLESLKNREQE